MKKLLIIVIVIFLLYFIYRYISKSLIKNKSIIVKVINKPLDFYLDEPFIHNRYYKLGLAPKLYDIFECDGKTYIVMESMDITYINYFFDYIPNHSPDMPLKDYISLMENINNDIYILITKANKESLFHNDLHGNNIMFKLDSGGKIQDIKLIDFSRANIKSNKLGKTEPFKLSLFGYLFVYSKLMYELLLSFNTKLEYDMWIINNKEKIINKVKEMANMYELISVFSKDNLSIFYQIFTIFQTFYLAGLKNELITFGNFILSLFNKKIDDFYVKDLKVTKFDDFYKLNSFDTILNKKFNSIEPFGIIKDCKTRVTRSKFLELEFKNNITFCDWTKISDIPIEKGVDGEVYKVRCD